MLVKDAELNFCNVQQCYVSYGLAVSLCTCCNEGMDAWGDSCMECPCYCYGLFIIVINKKHITQHVQLLTTSLEPHTCSCAVACGAHPISKGARIGHLLWFSASTVLHG